MSDPGLDTPSPLPDGTRLLHIGPHKTGTTAVQAAFHFARRAAMTRGVRYAGPGRTPAAAVQAAVWRRPGRSKPWSVLLREVRSARERIVVISSEWFADASDAAAAAIVEDLDPGRVHVVVTLRPLARILPSQWQQFVQGDSTIDYPGFLDALFGDADIPDVARFWHRHRHGRLVERWAGAAGAANVTVIIADEGDPGAVFRAMESLAGLGAGTLVPEDGRRNRSLTWPEIEVVRAVNRRLMAEPLGGRIKQGLVLYGAAAAVRGRRPRPSEPRIETPPWALERAAQVARDEAARIAASGVRVIGHLASLSDGAEAAASSERDAAQPAAILNDAWAEIAACAAIGVLRATGLTRAEGTFNRSLLGMIPTSRLVAVIAGRLRDRPTRAVPSGETAAAATEAADGTAGGATRSDGATVTLADEARAAFMTGLREAGFRDDRYRGVQAEIDAELAASVPRDWPEAAAALAVGVVRAAGYLGSTAGRRVRPRRAALEVPEVVEVSTAQLGLAIADRVLRGGLARARGGGG